jgi:hypothetical protein
VFTLILVCALLQLCIEDVPQSGMFMLIVCVLSVLFEETHCSDKKKIGYVIHKSNGVRVKERDITEKKNWKCSKARYISISKSVHGSPGLYKLRKLNNCLSCLLQPFYTEQVSVGVALYIFVREVLVQISARISATNADIIRDFPQSRTIARLQLRIYLQSFLPNHVLLIHRTSWYSTP